MSAPTFVHGRSAALASFAATLIAAALFPAAPAAAQNMCTGTALNPSAPCYRLLCNTVVAEGYIREDECLEACDLNTPSKWATPFIDVTAETLSGSIDNMSAANWTSVVNASLAAWNDIPSSNLQMSLTGGAPSRTFAGNTALHEVFWIQSQAEFEQKVGGGVFGALGVTVARYDIFLNANCGDREIYDADLVMNGVPAAGFNWSGWADDCPGAQYCSNAQGTLMHELGHFIGFGHPCATDSCESWSIMAATSAPSFAGEFNPAENLRTADYAGAEDLYPGTPGGLGSGCSGGGCSGGLSCQSIDGNSYCTHTCTSDASCEAGFECDTEGTGYCVFPGSIEPEVGQSCTGLGQNCANGQGWCLGPEGGDGTCYAACNPQNGNADCTGADEECFGFEGFPDEGFCFPGLAGPGEFCDDVNVFCGTPNVCISGACRTPCDAATGGGCGAGFHCFYFNDTCDPGTSGDPCFMGDTCPSSAFCPDYSYCMPAGASLEGATCDDVFDCAAGKVCLIDGPGNASHCYQRCDQSFTCSSPTQECVDLPDPANPDQSFLSYCNPLNTGTPVGDGDGDGDGDGPGDGDGDGDGDNPGDGDGDGDNVGDGDGDGDIDPPDGACNPARGNWDCPDEMGCDESLGPEGFGECVSDDSLYGDVGTGGLCEEDSDCYGGLCVRGVCTLPCDLDCPANYACDSGICVPEDCSGDEVCGEDFSCEETSTGDTVCAKGGGGLPFCSCVVAGGDADAGGPVHALALLAGFGLVFVRRQRRR